MVFSRVKAIKVEVFIEKISFYLENSLVDHPNNHGVYRLRFVGKALNSDSFLLNFDSILISVHSIGDPAVGNNRIYSDVKCGCIGSNGGTDVHGIRKDYTILSAVVH